MSEPATWCVRVRLKPNSLPRVRAWGAEINRRKDEAMQTLRDETVRIESVFLETSAEGDALVYYMRVDDPEACKSATASSKHAIDVFHREVMEAVTESRVGLELLLDLDRTRE